MGVYIKDMDMPEVCLSKVYACPGVRGFMGELSCWFDGEYIEPNKKRKDCPLIEVPPHGRLIDADRALADNEKYFDQLGRPEDEIQNRYNAVRASIRLAPTIIPAEEEDNG